MKLIIAASHKLSRPQILWITWHFTTWLNLKALLCRACKLTSFYSLEHSRHPLMVSATSVFEFEGAKVICCCTTTNFGWNYFFYQKLRLIKNNKLCIKIRYRKVESIKMSCLWRWILMSIQCDLLIKAWFPNLNHRFIFPSL